jgi:putative inorganic carbon (HCO3(-)) transporter
MGQFSGPESGFSTNQIAGVMLYVLPLMIAICIVGLRQRGWRWWLLFICTGIMGASFILTQSRGGYVGLLVALVTLLLLTQRWGWYALAALCAVGGLLIFYTPSAFLEIVSDAPGVGAVGGLVTVKAFRFLVWEAGNQALQEFFFTGMGLGTFRALVHLLYPLPGIPPSYDLAHAHNFFLQTGLDFGVPGMLAILAVYGAAIVQIVRLAKVSPLRPIWEQMPYLTPHVLAVGWMACMVGQTMYSLFDAVAMGSKPNFVWWWWMALIFAAGNCLLRFDAKTSVPPST